MSGKTPSVGIDHPTVVPANFDGDDATETDGGPSADASAEPRTEDRSE